MAREGDREVGAFSSTRPKDSLGILRGATVTGRSNRLAPAAPEARAGGFCQPEQGYNKAGAVGFQRSQGRSSRPGGRLA